MSGQPSWLEGLTWICHVCRDERPDAEIAVMKRTRLDEAVVIGNNFRAMIETHLHYCVDRKQCALAAQRWHSEGTLLRETKVRSWQVFRRLAKRRWERKHGPCVHAVPTYGDQRGQYGYRCARCFVPCEPVPWP